MAQCCSSLSRHITLPFYYIATTMVFSLLRKYTSISFSLAMWEQIPSTWNSLAPDFYIYMGLSLPHQIFLHLSLPQSLLLVPELKLFPLPYLSVHLICSSILISCRGALAISHFLFLYYFSPHYPPLHTLTPQNVSYPRSVTSFPPPA